MIMFELCNLICSVFMLLYGYVCIYWINWKLMVTSNNTSWFAYHTTPVCQPLCAVLVKVTFFVTTCIIVWSILGAFFRIVEARATEKCLKCRLHYHTFSELSWREIQRSLIDWDHLDMSDNEIDKIVATYISSDNSYVKDVCTVCRIPLNRVSRFFIWALESVMA